MIKPHVVNAVFRKNLGTAFRNPAAYVFITIFIVTCSVFQFSWGDVFFNENMAELGPLSASFPYLLLFFVPVLTMNSWSEERKLGTEEFILTLPATDFEVILGKYIALLVTYMSSLFFSLSLIFVLKSMGSPDMGLIVANYVAYLLLGAAMLSIGMVASMLTANATIAFILGVLFNSIFMFTGKITAMFSSINLGSVSAFLEGIGFGEKTGLLSQFNEMSSGVLTLQGIIYLISITATMLYLSMVLIGRRHWAHGQSGSVLSIHFSLRTVSLIVALTALNVVLSRSGARIDLTSEQIHSFSPASAKLMNDLTKPVLIEAYVSEEVPESHIEVRKNLLSTLREVEAESAGKVRVLIHTTDSSSKEADEAEDKYNIRPQTLNEMDSGSSSSKEVFLGVAVTSGANQEVIPFMDRGLSPEYELVRSIRVVSQTKRKKVGILKTDANVTGGMDFQRRQPIPAWLVVEELRKQYEIIEVDNNSDYPADIDVLLAILPSSLEQPQMDRLQKYILSGRKSLLLCDALPLNMPQNSPSQRHKPGGGNPMMGGGGQGAVKGDIKKLLSSAGVDFSINEIVWSSSNPYPGLSHLPFEIPMSQNDNEEFGSSEITSGLQVVVTMFPGHVSKAKDSWITFEPLVSIKKGNHGTSAWSDMVMSRGPMAQVRREDDFKYKRKSSTDPFHLGAYVTGSKKEGENDLKVDMAVFTDMDFISDQFFGLRRQGIEGLDFDNVTLFLNAIDFMVGDKDYIALRKKRKQHRTLTKFDELRKAQDKKMQEIVKDAEKSAEKEIDNAQKVLNDAVAKVKAMKDMKQEDLMRTLSTVTEQQNRALNNRTRDINRKKDRKIKDAEREMNEAMKAHKNKVVTMAVVLPTLLPLFIALIVFVRRRSRETRNVSKSRMKGGA